MTQQSRCLHVMSDRRIAGCSTGGPETLRESAPIAVIRDCGLAITLLRAEAARAREVGVR
jgi:hypothetical protein